MSASTVLNVDYAINIRLATLQERSYIDTITSSVQLSTARNPDVATDVVHTLDWQRKKSSRQG